jgi:hypothetical protein
MHPDLSFSFDVRLGVRTKSVRCKSMEARRARLCPAQTRVFPQRRGKGLTT